LNDRRTPRRERPSKRLSIRALLKPHWGALSLGLSGVIGEGVANLLEPWPLKIWLDDVLRSRESHAGVMRWVHHKGMVEDAAKPRKRE
jgi:hypothetical protein